MGSLAFRILGPMEADINGHPVDLGRPRQRCVLAALLTQANTVVSVERLVDLLWGQRPPARAIDALHVYVSGLRRGLEPTRAQGAAPQVLVTRPPGYVIEVGPDAVDACRFESLAAEAHGLVGIDAIRARALLGEALSLWRGAALAEFGFAPFAPPESARLEELRAVAIEDRLATDLAIGDNAGLVAELEMLITERPLRERLWALLMMALYRAERQGDALRAFARARAVLVEELGIEPGPALRRLETGILNQDASLELPSPLSAGEDRSSSAGSLAEPRRGQGSSGDLVGRDWQLGMLEDSLATACGGDAQVLLVSGEPGIGKTRLVEQLAVTARDAGATVAWGGCRESQGTPSFWPWVQVLRSLLGHADGDPSAWAAGAGQIAQILPEIKDVVPDAAAPPPLDGAEARFHLFEAVTGVLDRLAQAGPLVVVLDDIHWADVASLELVEFVADRVRAARMLFVCTYRDVDPAIATPLAEALGALARLQVQRLALTGLHMHDVGRLMALAGFEVGPAVSAAVYARTDGNPFFVTELARLLATEESLGDERGPDRVIPAGVGDVIRRRFARLPENTQDLLAQAAVLGREVDLRLVTAAVGDRGAVTFELIDAAVAVGILVEDGAALGRYRFCHALVQEAVYDQLAPAVRTRLHANAAAAISIVFGDDNSRVIELAHHLYEAAPAIGPEQGLEAAQRAAKVAQARLAYEQAEEQLRRALALIDTMALGHDRSSRELEVQHRLAALLSSTQGYHSTAVAAAWQRARELARELGDAPEVLASLWGLARLARARGQHALSQRLGEELLELDHGRRVTDFEAAGHESCGIARLYLGDLPSARRHLSEVVAMTNLPTVDGGTGGLVTNPGVLCRSYLAHVHWLEDANGDSYELADSALHLARASGDPMNEALALLVGCVLAIMRGDVDRSVEWGGAVTTVAERAGIGPLALLGVVLGGWGRAHSGDPTATADMAHSLSELKASGWRLAWTLFCGARGDALRVAGDLDAALSAVDEGLAEAERTGEQYYEAELCRLRGELMVARWPERVVETRTWLERALVVANRQGAIPFRARAEKSLSELRLHSRR